METIFVSGLVVADRFGREVDGAQFRKSTLPKPKLGEQYGAWSGRDVSYIQMPGGGMLNFDLSRLTLADYRSMKDHYQIGASLNVLSFILHQIDWKIECETDEIREVIEKNLRDIWTPLIRALSQAFWCGYSPNVLNWENRDNYIIIDKVKDLVPEECKVRWKKVYGAIPSDGRQPAVFLNYDGIIQTAYGRSTDGSLSGTTSSGANVEIPSENTIWYPLMMENGDYYGRKLLKPAFPAWYFSQIVHLFANRYYERFGEPTAIGRADFDDTVIDEKGMAVSGKLTMERILTNLRSRSVVVLPADRDPETKEYEYDIEYLESQMRGADFERYLSRLDEEMSLAVFTPMLLFRTSNVGSYNLGQAHLKIFLWMLNAIAGDIKIFIQHYIVDRLHDWNFGVKAPKAVWTYRKLGKDDAQIYAQMLQALVAAGTVMPDLEEMGTAIGLTLREVQQITKPADDPESPDVVEDPEQGDSPPTVQASKVRANLHNVIKQMAERAMRTHSNGKPITQLGYKGGFYNALVDAGMNEQQATEVTTKTYDRTLELAPELAEVLEGEELREALGKMVDNFVTQLIA
jgi:hypothetical protein